MDNKIKVAEFFAGSRSVGNAAEAKGMEVFSIDWQPFPKIDWVGDVEDMKISDVPFVPDVVWGSPDCTTYTIAAISTHRNGTEPKSDYAKKCDSVNQHFLAMIEQWLLINHRAASGYSRRARGRRVWPRCGRSGSSRPARPPGRPRFAARRCRHCPRPRVYAGC